MTKGAVIGVLTAITLGVAYLLTYIYLTRGLTLVAKEAVPVYATVDDAIKWPRPPVIAELTPGQSVPVVECVDVKHYIVPKVRLPDGHDGFVLDGTYAIMRNGEQAFCP